MVRSQTGFGASKCRLDLARKKMLMQSRRAHCQKGPRGARAPGLAGCESFFHAQVNLYTNEHTLKRLRRAHYYFIRYWRVLCEVWLCAMRIGAVRGRASL